MSDVCHSARVAGNDGRGSFAPVKDCAIMEKIRE